MGIFKTKLGLTLGVLAVIATLSSACGPGAGPPPATPGPSGPGGNQPPAISSLTSAQTDVLPKGIVEIQCVASDADGDVITYKWSTTGGSFTGSGPTVSWVAPKDYGDYEVTVTVEDGRGNVTQATITLSVVSNRDPDILSLVANPTTVLPQGRSTITCAASDPDGDVLNYSWRTSGGSVTGVGKTVTWVAPDREGTFTITVTVDDGEGGQDVRDVSVTVTLAQKTAMFTPVPNETGTVSSTGDKDTSRTVAGDSETNVGYRAFWSFDLYSLRGTDVKDAKLTFTTKHVSPEEPSPFSKTTTGLGGLRIFAVRYQQGQLPNFSPDTYSELASVMWEPPAQNIDVTKLVRDIGLGISASDRLQVQASFNQQTNGNFIAQYVEWLKIELTVTYAEE